VIDDTADQGLALANWEDEGGPPSVETRRSRSSASWEAVPGLDWSAFSALLFPDARGHDGEPIKAYEAYLSRALAA